MTTTAELARAERENDPSRHEVEIAGAVTPKEAREILSRFNASHWRNFGEEKARYSIPANPKRDDDIRLAVFIENSEELAEAVRGLFSPAFLESFPAELPPKDRPFARLLRALQRFEGRR